MSEYRAIDTEALREQLGTIAQAINEGGIEREHEETIDAAFSEINSIINGFNQPIHIRDRNDSFEVIIEKGE